MSSLEGIRGGNMLSLVMSCAKDFITKKKKENYA
jgi:hypothetical protein